MDYGCLNTENVLLLTNSDVQNFQGGEGNQNMLKKNQTLDSQWPCFAAENQNGSTTGRYATGRFGLVLEKSSSFGKGKSITEDFVLKVIPIVCICNDSTHFSS